MSGSQLESYKYVRVLPFDISKDYIVVSKYKKLYIINVVDYLNGKKTMRCTLNSIVKNLNSNNEANINKLLSDESGINHFTPLRLKHIQSQFFNLYMKHIKEFYDWKDCEDWVLSEMELDSKALKFIHYSCC